MAILSWIVIGLIAGWTATELLGGRRLAGNLAVGLVGGLLGGMLFTRYAGNISLGFFGSLAGAAVGAAAFLVIWRTFKRAP